MPRKHLNVRLSEPGHARLEALRDEYGITMTTVVRALLAVAFEHPQEIRRILDASRKVEQ